MRIRENTVGPKEEPFIFIINVYETPITLKIILL